MEKSLSKFCRTCLTQKVQLVNLDSVNFAFKNDGETDVGEEVSLVSCLNSIGISIPVSEVSCSKMCLVCIREVEIAGKFKFKAMESERIIQEKFGQSSSRKILIET